MLELPSFNHIKILVVGDVMLDRYWYGGASRISPEAPVPIVEVQRTDDRPGGAANVALNINALGGMVQVLGIVGVDDAANILQQRLNIAGIQGYFQHEPGLPTITKLRVISQNQQLIRLDFEQQFSRINKDYLNMQYETLLDNANLVILSDYNKGTLDHCEYFIELARARHIPILVDPKGNDFSRYRGATLLTPNLKEFEQIVGRCNDEDELVRKGLGLIKQLDLSALLITRGSKGMTLLRSNHPELHLPARAREVYDVTGAGDTVIAVLAAALAAGESLPQATTLANYAAGIVVGHLGAASVTVPELRRTLQKVSGKVTGVMSQEQLYIAVEDAKAHGETIAVTDGVFDILNWEQVKLLKKAKNHAQRLIVMVYDNASVQRIQGKGQPLNSLERRIQVIASMGCVDWVVSVTDNQVFSLLHQTKPECLVITPFSEFSKLNSIPHDIVSNVEKIINLQALQLADELG